MNKFFDTQTLLLDENGATICDLNYHPQKVISITDAVNLLTETTFKQIVPSININNQYNLVYFKQEKDIVTVVLEYAPKTWKINWSGCSQKSINLPFIYISVKYQVDNNGIPKIFRYQVTNEQLYKDKYIKYFPDDNTYYGKFGYLATKKNICVKIGMSPTPITKISDPIFFTFLPNFFHDLHICWPNNARYGDPINLPKNLVAWTNALAIQAISIDEGSADVNLLNGKLGLSDATNDYYKFHPGYQKYIDDKKYLYGVPMEYML